VLGALAPWALTVLHHAWWGVDLFFVVSGLSLALGYVRAVREGATWPTARGFFKRRAARIYPAYLAAIALVLVTHPSFFSRAGITSSLAVHALLLQGYVLPAGIVLIGASWSLTTEASFYLLLPAIARPLFRARRPLAVALSLVVVGWVMHAVAHALVLEPGQHTALLEDAQRRWITSRLDQFLLGSAAAILYASDHNPLRGHPGRARAVLAVAIAILVVAFRLEGELYLTKLGALPYPLMSLATTAIAFAALDLDPPRFLAWIGTVSYGVFLSHQLLIGFVGALTTKLAGTWTGLLVHASLALGASLIVAAASYRWLEKPVIRWAR
jgi:peptidoglycan/LPS O-acetylase OafA/YrhL